MAHGLNSRQLRVLAVTPDFPPAIGGIQLLFHRVLKNARHLRTRVVTIAPPREKRLGASDDNVVRSRRMRDHRVDVLLMNGLAIQEAYRFRPDLVFSSHIVCTPAATAISRLFGVPTVLYVHGSEVAASPILARFGLRNSSVVIAVSRYARSLALAAGARQSQIHVIPPGVDSVEPSGVLRRETPTIITVARLEERYKGHDTMVRALPLIRARIPRVEWVVIGDGQLREEIAELADANGVGRSVVMLGSVSDAERNAWFDSAHVFAMPSRLPAGQAAGEGFGIVYLEAGVHGLPVVAGNAGGAIDAVVHGETGLLVDPTSNLAVADAITELLLDRKLAARMGRSGEHRAQQFSWPAISARVEELLQSVAGRAPQTRQAAAG